MNGKNDQLSIDNQMNDKIKNDNELTNRKSLILPPNRVSGLKELDRSKFEKAIQVSCLKVDTKELKSVLKLVKPYLLKKPKLSPIIRLGKNLIIDS